MRLHVEPVPGRPAVHLQPAMVSVIASGHARPSGERTMTERIFWATVLLLLAAAVCGAQEPPVLRETQPGKPVVATTSCARVP